MNFNTFHILKPVVFSLSRTTIDLLFLRLKDSGRLFTGCQYYSEFQKNTIKVFLRQEWKWSNKHIIIAIKEWLKLGWISLDNDILTFKTTDVFRGI